THNNVEADNIRKKIEFQKGDLKMTGPTAKIRRGYVDVPGGQLHYRTAGEGPCVLMLHPNTYSSDYFSDVIPLFAPKYRVIALDRFGHGYSDQPPPDFPEYKE